MAPNLRIQVIDRRERAHRLLANYQDGRADLSIVATNCFLQHCPLLKSTMTRFPVDEAAGARIRDKLSKMIGGPRTTVRWQAKYEIHF